MEKKKGEAPAKSRSRDRRVAANLPVNVRGTRGRTQNISASGMYIVQNDQLPVGSRVEFTIELQTPVGPMNLFCEGEVARVEQVDGQFGLGVRIIRQSAKTMLLDAIGVADPSRATA